MSMELMADELYKIRRLLEERLPPPKLSGPLCSRGTPSCIYGKELHAVCLDVSVRS